MLKARKNKSLAHYATKMKQQPGILPLLTLHKHDCIVEDHEITGSSSPDGVTPYYYKIFPIQLSHLYCLKVVIANKMVKNTALLESFPIIGSFA